MFPQLFQQMFQSGFGGFPSFGNFSPETASQDSNSSQYSYSTPSSSINDDAWFTQLCQPFSGFACSVPTSSPAITSHATYLPPKTTPVVNNSYNVSHNVNQNSKGLVNFRVN